MFTQNTVETPRGRSIENTVQPQRGRSFENTVLSAKTLGHPNAENKCASSTKDRGARSSGESSSRVSTSYVAGLIGVPSAALGAGGAGCGGTGNGE